MVESWGTWNKSVSVGSKELTAAHTTRAMATVAATRPYRVCGQEISDDGDRCWPNLCLESRKFGQTTPLTNQAHTALQTKQERDQKSERERERERTPDEFEISKHLCL